MTLFGRRTFLEVKVIIPVEDQEPVEAPALLAIGEITSIVKRPDGCAGAKMKDGDYFVLAAPDFEKLRQELPC